MKKLVIIIFLALLLTAQIKVTQPELYNEVDVSWYFGESPKCEFYHSWIAVTNTPTRYTVYQYVDNHFYGSISYSLADNYLQKRVWDIQNVILENQDPDGLYAFQRLELVFIPQEGPTIRRAISVKCVDEFITRLQHTYLPIIVKD